MNILRLLAVLAASFAGGAFANWSMHAMPALAQTAEPAKPEEKPAEPEKPATPANVEAQSFVLKDKDGNTRATLALSDEGEPQLTFKDKAGAKRATVGLFNRDDGHANAGLSIYGETGKPTTSLIGYAENIGGFTMQDADGKTRISLDTETDKTATINVRSADGIRNITLAAFEKAPSEHTPKWDRKGDAEPGKAGGSPDGGLWRDDEGPSIFLRVFSTGSANMLIIDRHGSQRAGLGISDNGFNGLTLLDENEKVTNQQGAWPDGTRGTFAYHDNGKLAAFEGVYSTGTAGFNLRDHDGKLGVHASVDRKGATGFQVFGADEKLRGQLIVSSAEVSRLAVYDKTGVMRGQFASFANCTQLQLIDKAGVTRFVDSQWDDGDVSTSLYAAADKPRISLNLSGDDSELRIWDPESHQRATVGYVSKQTRMGVYDKQVTFRAGSWIDDATNSASSTVRKPDGASVWEQSGK